jgi:hypothetical protein
MTRYRIIPLWIDLHYHKHDLTTYDHCFMAVKTGKSSWPEMNKNKHSIV